MGSVGVSVVVPCHNSAPWLRDTLDSLEAQTTDDLEVVLVDDGSTDGTAGLIARLVIEKPSLAIRSLSQPNAGLAAARNLGIGRAEGRYVLPLDADDLVTEDFVERCAAVLDENGEVDVVYTDRLEFGAVERLIEPGPLALDQLRYFNRISYCSMYRRTMWEAIGGYRTNVTGFDDWDLWVAAAARGCRARYLRGPRLLHRRRDGSQMGDVIGRYQELFARIILNNTGLYAPAEIDAAEALLDHGERHPLFPAAEFVFRRHYEGTWAAAR